MGLSNKQRQMSSTKAIMEITALVESQSFEFPAATDWEQGYKAGALRCKEIVRDILHRNGLLETDDAQEYQSTIKN